MEQNSRLKPATKHVIRCAAALAYPKMAPTFLIGQTLNNVSALSTALNPAIKWRHLAIRIEPESAVLPWSATVVGVRLREEVRDNRDFP